MNYELLRIIAMLMIVCLHYLSKGGALGDSKGELSATGYAAWMMEAFCLVAVNVYVLISGYFGVDSTTFTIRKPLKIWGQVWFYSVVIGLVALFSGIASFDLYRFFTYVFPVIHKFLHLFSTKQKKCHSHSDTFLVFQDTLFYFSSLC